MRKTVVSVVFYLFVLSVLTYAPALAATPVVLAMADGMPEEHAFNVAFRDFQKNVEERSNGGIKVEMFVNGQLGGDMVMLQAVQDGSLAMTWTASPSQVSFVPELAVFDIPFFFPTLEDAWKAVTNPDFVAAMERQYLAAGLRLMGLPTPGYRTLSANKPIRKLEDLKGLKIRTMENPYHVSFWKALGVTPTPLSSTERYAALQQGTVDGQENLVENAFNTKMYEVQSHFIKTRHIAYVSVAVMNAAFYDSLSEEHRKIVDEEIKKVCDGFQQLAMKNENDMLKTMEKDHKVTVIEELDPGEYERWREITADTEQLIRKDIGDEMVDLLYKAVGR